MRAAGTDQILAQQADLFGIHPGALAYWEEPYLANAMATANWLEFEEYSWGDYVEVWDNPQFDSNGYPRYLNEGRYLRSIINGLHGAGPLHRGHVVLTWQGSGDLRLSASSEEYLATESSGAMTGSLSDGRRVYRLAAPNALSTLEIYAIDPADPITDIKIWMADPADPLKRSLEGQLWHPKLLERIADFPNSVIRTMAMTMTNGNPERDWSDRRRPDHFSQVGQLNPRSPAPGALLWDNSPMPGNRATGVAWEYLVALANASDQDLWINLPHMASDDYIDKLGRLLRYGSDGVEPYSSTQANPRFAPLKPGLRVWVEYSNEIWAGGPGFAQGDYARLEGEAQGISQAQFNGRQFCNHWARLSRVMGDPSRVVKVLATFTGSSWYDNELQAEVAPGLFVGQFHPLAAGHRRGQARNMFTASAAGAARTHGVRAAEPVLVKRLVRPALRRRLGDQLRRMPAQLNLHTGLALGQLAACGVQVCFADPAPGADQVEIDVDLHRGGGCHRHQAALRKKPWLPPLRLGEKPLAASDSSTVS